MSNEKKLKLVVAYDQGPPNPVENWDMLGTFTLNRNEIPEDKHTVYCLKGRTSHCSFYCYITEEDIIKEYGELNEENISKAEGVMEGEAKVYKQWLEGEVYGYKLYNVCECCGQTTDLYDSCYSFYDKENMKFYLEEFGEDVLSQLDEAWGNPVV